MKLKLLFFVFSSFEWDKTRYRLTFTTPHKECALTLNLHSVDKSDEVANRTLVVTPNKTYHVTLSDRNFHGRLKCGSAVRLFND